MRRPRTVLAVALLAALVVVVLAGRSVTHEPSLPAPGSPLGNERVPLGITFGSHLTGLPADRLNSELDEVAGTGAGWIRIDVTWLAVQYIGPQMWDWAPTDRVVRAARAHHLRVLAVLTYSPPWARDPRCPDFNCPPADDSAFAHFVAGAVRHYGRSVAAYELWNEPNIRRFWVAPDADRYGHLLAAVVHEVRGTAPHARLLFGGMAPNPTRDGAVVAADFLATACSAERCAGLAGVAYHPYTYPLTPLDRPAVSTAWQRIYEATGATPSLLGAMQEVGLGRTRLWLTEVGAPTVAGAPDGATAGRDTPLLTEAQQACIVATSVVAAETSPRTFGGLFIHTLEDDPPRGSKEDHFGLVRADGTHKPAYAAMARAAGARSFQGLPSGCAP